jgi:hypothetical protein
MTCEFGWANGPMAVLVYRQVMRPVSAGSIHEASY